MAMAAFAMLRNSTRLNRVLTAATSSRYLFWDNMSMLSTSVGNGAIFVLEPPYRCRQFSSNELPTHNVVQMPALSPTMEKGNIASWKKKEGDKIEAGDVMCEIETDKATLDFESLEDGFLGKILVPAGSNDVAVGQPLAILVDKLEDVARLITLNAEQFSQGQKPRGQKLSDTSAEHAPHDKETKDLQGFRFGPAVRRLLEEFNVDLTALRSTGPRGTLLKADVLTAIRSGKVAKFSATVDTSKVSEVIIRDKNVKNMPSSMPLSSLEAYDDVANTQIRKIIAKRLMESKHGIPHIYLSSKVIIDPLLDLRKDMKEKHGLKVSVNDIVIKVVALALKAVPEANAYWSNENEQVVPCSSVDISIAVATEKGLMTPILRNADQKTLSAISAEVKELAEKARHGKLIPSEFQGGTFSISNLGMFPVDQFCAIINPPQAGILAVGRGNKSVCWKEDISGEEKLFSVTEMTMTLSADHRVFNYDVGVRFLDTLNANFKEIKRLLL